MTDEAAVNRMLDEYYAAFSTLNIQAILPYFHQPALLIGPPGVIALPTLEAVLPIFAPVMQNLRARGYGRSELSRRKVKLLSANSALATGIAVRYKSDGPEMKG